MPTPVTHVTYVLVGKVHHSLEVRGFGWMTRESQKVILRLKLKEPPKFSSSPLKNGAWEKFNCPFGFR